MGFQIGWGLVHVTNHMEDCSIMLHFLPARISDNGLAFKQPKRFDTFARLFYTMFLLSNALMKVITK